MAVYYKWIKGCAPGADLTKGAWTYITWGTKDSSNANESLPTLTTKTGRDGVEKTTNLGYFLTNKANGVQIWENWDWVNATGISFDSSLAINKDGLRGSFTIGESGQTLVINSTTTLNSSLQVNSTITTTGQINTASVVSSGSVQGSFFNATSDKRAKENIKLASYSALDLIQKLPIYTYNYKSNHETVTGVMAQDLLEVQPKELNLVSNITATGENGDYMSIKNDKLMFVLMKAIQEQQEKINHLEEELNKLKNN